MIIAFEDRESRYWWDWFIGNPRHCFRVIKADNTFYAMEFTFTGIYTRELTDLHKYRFYDIKGSIGKYRAILTCSQFCASMIGIRGIVLTPKQLERKIKHGRIKSIFST